MGDRSSRKEAATILTAGRWRSCCRRCGRKKKKLNNHPDHHHQGDNHTEAKMLKSSTTGYLCNPLGYVLNRQINDRIDYCKKLVDARFFGAQNLFRKDLYSHYGCINAIEFSKEGDLLVSGGDDKRVLLWNVEKAIQEHGKPIVMKAQHMSNIFCLGYNSSKSKIFSAGNDDQVIVHDLQTTDVLNFFRHEKPVYGLSVHPYNDNVFSSACDDGRVLIYDIRGSASSAESFFCLAQHKNSFHSVMFNPVEPVMLVTANAKEGVSMWDVRKPLKPVLRYGSEGPAQSCMNVRFNEAGTTLLALRRRLPPVLYAVNSATHLCQFDHPGYYNSCTMKSCCFAGNNDEYILSGSDDFNLYMWKIPTDDSIKWVDSAHMILRSHRSIVNQVRYNQANYVLASSGVEKIIKLWSPFPLSHKCLGGLKRDDDKEEKQRRVYTHDEYIGLVLRSGQFMTHDYSHQSTDEDQRMMAFFDSLVQREIESWSSEDVPTPQSPSDPENNNATDHNNVSDSEDSTASENQLMRRFIASTFNSLASSSAPDRPLESPNRITRLIANRREKLMRLAALEAGTQSKTSSSAASSSVTSTITTTTTAITKSTPKDSAAKATVDLSQDIESCSASDLENDDLLRNNKSKASRIMLRSKTIIKRKHSNRLSSARSRTRRKLCNAKEESDTEANNQLKEFKNTYQSLDATQPSTSSGVMSVHRSRFVQTPPIVELRRHSRPSSSSSGDSEIKAISNHTNKRRNGKTDSDSSTKEFQKKKVSRIKNKASTSSVTYVYHDNRVKSKRQKLNNEEVDIRRCSSKSTMKEVMLLRNASENRETLVTPTKDAKHLVTSDSGITSGVSTTEKNNASSMRSRAESSDRERTIKNLEWFKKKVDVARRGYRKRVMLPLPSSSESSDD